MSPEAEVSFLFTVESSFKQKPLFKNYSQKPLLTRMLLSYWLHFPRDENTNDEACLN